MVCFEDLHCGQVKLGIVTVGFTMSIVTGYDVHKTDADWKFVVTDAFWTKSM